MTLAEISVVVMFISARPPFSTSDTVYLRMTPFGNSGSIQLMMAYVDAISTTVTFLGALGAREYISKNNNNKE